MGSVQCGKGHRWASLKQELETILFGSSIEITIIQILTEKFIQQTELSRI